MKPIAKNQTFHANLEARKNGKNFGLSKELTNAEVTEYNEACRTITKGLQTFVEVGDALIRIRDGKLYREEFDTFEECCQIKFGMSRQHGYRYIIAAEVKRALSENVTQRVTNYKQAESLSKAAPEDRPAILKEVASEGKVTAAAITAKIEEKKKEKPFEAEFKEVIKDANGDDVPDKISKEFQRVESEAKEAVQFAQRIKNYLEQDDRTTVEARGLRETAKDLLAGLKTHLTKHVLCPKCKGEKCAVCSRRGFVSKHFAARGVGKSE